jgi:hypothetical protein
MASTTTAPRIHTQAGIPPESLVDAASDTAPDAAWGTPWGGASDAVDDAVLGGVVAVAGRDAAEPMSAGTIVNEIVPLTASPPLAITR